MPGVQSLTKRHLSAAELDALLREQVGVGCRLEAELTDGEFNSAYRVRLEDGRPAVLKLAPPPGAAVLRYERGIMATEAMVYRRLADLPGGHVPGPELLHAGEDVLVLSVLDGTPWNKAGDRIPGAAVPGLRRELGAITARLNTLTPPDGRFGYPAPASGLSAPDWHSAFGAMVEALLDDAGHWRSPLGIAPAEVRTLVAEGRDALAEVTEPRLVHFDLWQGNVFVRLPATAGGRHTVSGIIDHERAFWGDPAAELVSLNLGGEAGPDDPLVAGYTAAGGRFAFGEPGFHHRLALYRLYLGLLLVIECSPRGFGPERLAHCQGFLADSVTALRALG